MTRRLLLPSKRLFVPKKPALLRIWDEEALEYSEGGGGLISLPSVDPVTIAWVAAVVAAGGTVSPTQQSRVDALIKGLKTDGNFARLDCLWLWGGESISQQATIDIINLVVGTNVSGNLTLGASGYTGNALSGFFDTNANLNTFANYAQNSASIGFYVINSRVAVQSWQDAGVDTTATTNFAGITPLFSDGNTYFNMNDATSNATVGSNAQGQWIASRVLASGAGAQELRRNQSSFLTSTAASTGVAAGHLVFFALNETTIGDSRFSGDTMAAGFFGSGLTSAQSDQVASRINAYMTAWGISVY